MAGVDQGTADIFTEMASPDLAPLFGQSEGIGPGPGQPRTHANYAAEAFSIGALTGPVTDAPRPALVKPAGIEQASTAPDPDSVTPMKELWWEKVHLLPRSIIDFGNIITQEQDEYEIYSALRRASVTMTAIDDSAVTPGIDLPDISAPLVVPPQSSILDPATTDNCADLIQLGVLEKLDIIAETNGLPTFNGAIDFSFPAANDVSLRTSGSRVVLIPQDYESPVKETLAFLTDIITALSGKEQRKALRKNPRQFFEVTYLLTENERQRMQALLMDWTGNVFGFPVQWEKLTMTSAVSAGATQYQVTGADDVDMRVGGLAVVFTDANTFDVLNLDAVTDTLLTASDPSVNAYPAGTVIYPLRTAYIRGATQGSRAANNLERFKMVFEVTDNDTGALAGDSAAYVTSTHDSKVLFDDCNVLAQDEMPEQFARRIHRIDNQTGKIDISTPWDRSKRASQKGFQLRGRAQIKAFRETMIALRGRQKSFYIPTFIEDLTPKAGLTIATDTMDVERIEYERFMQNRAPKSTFKITFTDGTSLVRDVVSSAGVDSTTERLDFDGVNWPATRTLDEIVRVQFYEESRFDSDNVVIRHDRDSQARCTMPVKQVFDSN